MKQGETLCYYRAPGGEKSIYVTLMYQHNRLQGSMICKNETKRLNSDNKDSQGCVLLVQEAI